MLPAVRDKVQLVSGSLVERMTQEQLWEQKVVLDPHRNSCSSTVFWHGSPAEAGLYVPHLSQLEREQKQ